MLRRCFSHIRLVTRAQEGVAYLEFAIVLPFLLALLMGSIEVTRYILIAQKLEKVAVTISDVTSQGSTISTSDLDNIITAASQVMQPYTFGANGYVIVTSVRQTGTSSGSNPPRVNWQYTGGGTWTQTSMIGTPGSAATLPNGMTLFDRDNIIITEVFYNYQPLLSTNGVITGTSLYKVGVFKPRLGDLSTLSALPLFWQPRKGVLL
jgi:Flp pilus assembly protein TadG